MERYIRVTPMFYTVNQGLQRGCNVLNCALTLSGDYVCSVNTRDEFPDLFTGSEEEVDLDISDFPATERIL